MYILQRAIVFCVVLIYCEARSPVSGEAISPLADGISVEADHVNMIDDGTSMEGGNLADDDFLDDSYEDWYDDAISNENSTDDYSNESLRRPRIVGGVDDERDDVRGSCPITVQPTPDLPNIYSPLECARTCREGERPRICYYYFQVEYYSTLSSACDFCQSNETNAFCNNCQCITMDGVQRGVISVNRMIPGPTIDVCEGDKIVVDVDNRIEGEEITIHWHGIFQKDSQYYDGAAHITQCPIPEQATFRYQFNADNAGTHFWHAHTGMQKIDGAFGRLIVRRPETREVHRRLYDFDLSRHGIILSDWMHEFGASRIPGRVNDPLKRIQDPDSVLINGRGRAQGVGGGEFITDTNLSVFNVEPNRRYRFRLVNTFCTVCAAILTVEGHDLTIIAVDGISVKPVVVNSIISVSGERYDFIINTHNKDVGSYWIQLRADTPCESKGIHQLAILQYEGAPKEPATSMPTFQSHLSQGIVLNPLDSQCDQQRTDAICVSNLESAERVDRDIYRRKADAQIYLPFRFYRYDLEELFAPNSFNRFVVANGNRHTVSYVDDISLRLPPSPPLSQLEDIPQDLICNSTYKPSSCSQDPCICTHVVDLPYNGIVELILVDETNVVGLHHPFHLHGFAFNIMSVGVATNQTEMTVEEVRRMDEQGLIRRRRNKAPYKDTIAVPNMGYAIVRFRANNPDAVEPVFLPPGFYEEVIERPVYEKVIEPPIYVEKLPPPHEGQFYPPLHHDDEFLEAERNARRDYEDAPRTPHHDRLIPKQTAPIAMFTDPERNPNHLKYRQHRNKKPSSIVAGLDLMRPIDERSCLHSYLAANTTLSSPVQCARTCRKNDRRICYYNFVVEYYQVNGLACTLCKPTSTNEVINRFCGNCQCVLGDGVERSAMIVNRQLPGPAIEVCEGDHVVIDVTNHMSGNGLSIHWHGLFQRGFQYYDGVPYVTQCPINSGETFRYQWGANNAGTHFWHAHSGLEKLDGVLGSLIVRQPPELDPHHKLYDYDLSNHVVLISDWMHEQAVDHFPGKRLSDIGQTPDSILINGKGRYTDLKTGKTTDTPLEVIEVEPDRRYRFRIINSFCTVCPGMITIEGHRITVIATDGENIAPKTVDSVTSFAGERYDFILHTNQTVGSYWIQVRGMGACWEKGVQQIAILRYKGVPRRPLTSAPSYHAGIYSGLILNALNETCEAPTKDTICVDSLDSLDKIDKGILRQQPDMRFYLPVGFEQYTLQEAFEPNHYRRFMAAGGKSPINAIIDGISYVFPPSPPLSQPEDIPEHQFCNRNSLSDECKETTCSCSHKLDIPLNAVVELVLVDELQATNLSHPFHLHGHSFYVMGMGQAEYVDNVDSINWKIVKDMDKKNMIKRWFNKPVKKDTVVIPYNGYVILRFRANNPGYWFFHCHFIYHQMVGMEMIMNVGKQEDVPPVPKNFPKCGSYIKPMGYNAYPPFVTKPPPKPRY